MSLSIIVATDLNNGIGYNNQLLYHIKEDLQRFKEITLNHKVVMGRKTFESLPNKKPLSNRDNIVITNNEDFLSNYQYDNLYCDTKDNIINKYKDSKEEVFIIGGASIYKQFIDYTDRIYLTRIYKDNKKSDSFFNIPYSKFRYKDIQDLKITEDGIMYKFIILKKK